MKIKLLMQSLSPLAILTVIKNMGSYVTNDYAGNKLTFQEFLLTNIVLITVSLICVIWVITSIWFYIEFKAFKWTDKKKGYQVGKIEDREEASLNFYITIIVPLLIDEVHTLWGALTLALIVLSLCILLYRTKLFYANPVLTFLGYRFYEFEFLKNEDSPGKCTGISQNIITTESVIEYKRISDGVYYIRGLTNIV